MSAALLPAAWPASPRVQAFTTLRHGAGVSAAPFDRFNLGMRNGDDPAAAAANRAALVGLAGLPAPPHWLCQVHGTAVLRLDAAATVASAPEREPEADAAVTGVPGVVLAVLSADCLPVVLAAADGSEAGVAHAGWRGLAAGVLEATVAAMRTAPDRLLAWLGPAAGPQAYEIGAEVRDAFVAQDPSAAAAFARTRPGHWHVDLYALARRRLHAAGLAADAIHGGGLCTISDAGRYYSHRRDHVTGRMATVAWLSPPR
ncbi:peptidoglycan editing factor PgeF [Pseudoxanthomonas koreensis]|uniref:peptidoglycan editing factor PgeF n=1 Tax=Pseudoxanthomonas koreensis TaxID=266061 RepID=UPI0035A5FEE3